MTNLLKNSIILDTETLGLDRGAGIHELAFFDLDTRHVQEFILNPNAVSIQAVTPQERTRLASAYADKYTSATASTWSGILRQNLQNKLGREVRNNELMAVLKQTNSWMADQMQYYPHLLGGVDDVVGRERRLLAHGITSKLGQVADLQDVLQNVLAPAMEGRTVWIANAPFESKQIGAALGAAGEAAAENFKSSLETRNPSSPDPFYVTGSEVTRARVLAQQTGDFTHVWRAYKQHVPKPGETAVRDILDVTRAMHSYGRKIGMASVDTQFMGSAIDISHRLFAYAADDEQRMNMKEYHRGAEDAALHEEYVLRRGVHLTEALEQVHERTDLGLKYVQQAEAGEGPLVEAARYFSAFEAHAPLLAEEQVLKRVGRAAEDIAEQGETYQVVGQRAYSQQQLTPQGEGVTAYRSMALRKKFTDLQEVSDHLESEGRYSGYGVDIQTQAQRIQSAPSVQQYVHSASSALHDQWGDVQVPDERALLRRTVQKQAHPLSASALQGVFDSAPAGAKRLAAVGAAIAVLGALVSPVDRQDPVRDSLLHYGYDQWAERQRIEGLSTGPVASASRHRMTDFGSPYRGPIGSEQVFIDQELLRERERWLRQQYGAAHYDPAQGLHSPFGAFRWGRGGYNFIQGSTSVRGEDYGLQGDLQAVDLSAGDWNVEVEDADTVVVRRAGFMGSVSSFFGLNRGYAFRLAGIDSPEIAHGSGSYHAPQPAAERVAAAVREQVAAGESNLLVFDPEQVTYGRMLGALVVDGRNLNMQIVQQGLAAHLPYGNPADSMINYRALFAAETRAYMGGRGMWSEPWARSFYEQSEAAGERITFNTLARVGNVVKNAGTMNMISAMEAAQASGEYSANASQLAQALGSRYKPGADNVSPGQFIASSAPSNSYMNEQMADLGKFTRTRGTGNKQNKFRAKGSYGRLDKTLVLDSLGASDNVMTRRRYAAFEKYNSNTVLKEARAARMAAATRKAVQTMGTSPIGHHRM